MSRARHYAIVLGKLLLVSIRHQIPVVEGKGDVGILVDASDDLRQDVVAVPVVSHNGKRKAGLVVIRCVQTCQSVLIGRRCEGQRREQEEQ